MKLKFIGCLVFLLISANIPLNVHAVSYVPAYFHQNEIVYMFESGTEDVRKAIHPNDTLTVYRIGSNCKLREIGKIKALSFIGDIWLKAEVVDGFIKPDDIAKENGASCMVIKGNPCGD